MTDYYNPLAHVHRKLFLLKNSKNSNPGNLFQTLDAPKSHMAMGKHVYFPPLCQPNGVRHFRAIK